MSTSHLPLYLVIKGPPPKQNEIDRQRRAVGISHDYDVERLHTTLKPLGLEKDWTAAMRRTLKTVLTGMHAPPFYIEFDRIIGNLLCGGEALRAALTFQRMIARRLTRSGLILPSYRFKPHVTLAYGSQSDRQMAIEPIGWTVEEFLLIRSGHGRHEPLEHWSLIDREPLLPLF
ncbi:MAG: hypothetical protein JO221_04580 [Sphingomonas sp.]|nr:hypothetical protein [Sphingomonas sp.]